VEKYEDFSRWSHCNGLPAQREKYEDFSFWSHCNGLPAQWGKIRGFFKSGHIVMGYLPREKNTRIFGLVTL